MVEARTMKEFKEKEIQLRPLFFLQEKLDKKMAMKFSHSDELMEEVKFKKILNFRTEVAELLNELRLQKYWCNQPPSNRDVILEEYVDGLHMIFGIGIDKGVKDYNYEGVYSEFTSDDLLFIFDQLFIMDYANMGKSHYEQALELYLRLGQLLIFDWNEIKEAYVRKNMINHERLEKGY